MGFKKIKNKWPTIQKNVLKNTEEKNRQKNPKLLRLMGC